MIYSTYIDNQKITIDSGNKCISKKVLKALTKTTAKVGFCEEITLDNNPYNKLEIVRYDKNKYYAEVYYKGNSAYSPIDTYSKTLETLHQYAEQAFIAATIGD